MLFLKRPCHALAGAIALCLASGGTAAAAPYVADITATMNGERVGGGSFTFDPEETAVLTYHYGRGLGSERITVYGLVEDLSFGIDAGLGPLTLWDGPLWMGDDPAAPDFLFLDDSGVPFGFDSSVTEWVLADGFFYGDTTFSRSLVFEAMGDSFVASVSGGPTRSGAFLDDLQISVTFNAVPVPAAGLLFLTGLGGLAGASRLRGRAGPRPRG